MPNPILHTTVGPIKLNGDWDTEYQVIRATPYGEVETCARYSQEKAALKCEAKEPRAVGVLEVRTRISWNSNKIELLDTNDAVSKNRKDVP